ncbi:MAG: response regulator [Deinococcales bacterium]
MKPVILCVDDEKMILDSLRAQMKKRYGGRFHYEFAEGAEEAFELIDELVEDGLEILLIVSDWLMPQMKGDVFLEKVHGRHPGIVKIMLSGQIDAEVLRQLSLNGMLHRLIHKPWTEGELFEAIESGLRDMHLLVEVEEHHG